MQNSESEGDSMAALEKFSQKSMVNHLRHIEREIEYPKNADIDLKRSHLNYSLSPDRGMRSYEYLKKRLGELHYINRDDVKLLAGWVITAPKDLDRKQYRRFFYESYNFLSERYGEENCIKAIVHQDESGEAHMHFYFIPVVKNSGAKEKINPKIKATLAVKAEHPEYSYSKIAEVVGCSKSAVHKWLKSGEKIIAESTKGEKVSARDLLNRKELNSFHPDLQRYLTGKGLNANVYTGVTRAQGGNITVEQLKAQREHLMRHGINVDQLIQDIDRTLDLLDQSSDVEDEFDM